VSRPLLLGLDDGTTAVKAALFDVDLHPVAVARRRVASAHPGPGLVEQDPLPLTPIHVWQDKRAQTVVDRMAGTEAGREVAARTGLPLDPYCSAPKLAWLLEHDDAVSGAVARGALEGIAWRVADIVEAVRAGVGVDALRVPVADRIEPRRDARWRSDEHAGWRAFVEAAAGLPA